MASIGIDIGGSKIAFGLVQNGAIVESRRLDNTVSGDVSALLLHIKTGVEQLCAASPEEVEKVGVGCPGWVVDGVVYEAVNLGIDRLDLQGELRVQLGLPVYVENDARTALLAELRHGALEGSINGALLTFGTGVGGALLLNGRLYRGSRGCAGELGHVTFFGTLPCLCGKNGCYEGMAAVPRLVALAHQAGAGLNNGQQVFDAARQDDPLVAGALEEYLDWVSVGPRELAMLLDLDTIALGGGISAERELFVNKVAQRVQRFAPHCRVVPARLGNAAGILGAAELPE